MYVAIYVCKRVTNTRIGGIMVAMQNKYIEHKVVLLAKYVCARHSNQTYIVESNLVMT